MQTLKSSEESLVKFIILTKGHMSIIIQKILTHCLNKVCKVEFNKPLFNFNWTRNYQKIVFFMISADKCEKRIIFLWLNGFKLRIVRDGISGRDFWLISEISLSLINLNRRNLDFLITFLFLFDLNV